MPLKNGCDGATIHQNISELVRAGHDIKQAIAIALDHARKQGCNIAPRPTPGR